MADRDPSPPPQRDLLAAAALAGLMAGELGRLFLTMDYQHMGATTSDRESRALTHALCLGRHAAAAAVLIADLTLERLALEVEKL